MDMILSNVFYKKTSVDTEMCCPKGKCGCQYFILLTLKKKIMDTGVLDSLKLMTLKTNSTVCTASKILKVLNHSGIKCVEIYPAVLNLQNIIRVFNGMGEGSPSLPHHHMTLTMESYLSNHLVAQDLQVIIPIIF
jgi:hypothetical protein